VAFGLFELSDKTALVTGGGSGLGRAICRGFAEVGARVAVTDISLESALETVALLGQPETRAYAQRGGERSRQSG
jgi:NAD(P)-dependent dehydrogenase (short-subunit alcohol dehydrogenase family)